VGAHGGLEDRSQLVRPHLGVASLALRSLQRENDRALQRLRERLGAREATPAA
jgi:hypothetical protein